MTTHILFVSHLHDLRGGAERTLLQNIRTLKNHDEFRCSVVLPHEGEFSHALDEIDVPYYILHQDWSAHTVADTRDFDTLAYAIQNTDTLLGAYELLEKLHPDIVITNTITIPWVAYVAHEVGIPTALNICELLDERNNIQLLPSSDEYLRLLIQTFDFLVYNSEYTKSTYAGALDALPSLIQYPEMSSISPLPAPTKLTKSTLDIIVPGTISRPKNQLEVIAALSLIHQQHPDIALSLTLLGQEGDAQYVDEVHTAISDAKLATSVKLLGYRPDPYSHILQHEIVVVPSTHEAFGKVTVEGMLLGRVVVGANAGGTREIITDDTGYLYESGSPESLADTLMLVLEQPTQAQARAKKAQRYATQRFLGDSYISDLQHIIEATKNAARSVGATTYNPLIAALLRNRYMNEELAKYSTSLNEAADRITLLEKSIKEKDADIHSTHIKLHEAQLEITRLHERSIPQIAKETIKRRTKKH